MLNCHYKHKIIKNCLTQTEIEFFFNFKKMDNLMKNKISASRDKIFGIVCS